jgi:hypothetical protein
MRPRWRMVRVDTGWGVATTLWLFSLPVVALRGNHPQLGPQRIDQFPHYQFASAFLRGSDSGREDYRNYLIQELQMTEVESERRILDFQLLLKNTGTQPILVARSPDGRYETIDGLHRSAAELAKSQLVGSEARVWARLFVRWARESGTR